MNRENKQRGLSRERLVEVALELIDEQGLDALSMRALADRLDAKAASLYWHVRDRDELVQLVADELLEAAGETRMAADWRTFVTAAAAALGRTVTARRDAARLLLGMPGALERSHLYSGLVSRLESAGLSGSAAREVALMVMAYVIAASRPADEARPAKPGAPASIAIDSGSRGVVVRAGPADMQALIHVPSDQAAAAPAVVHGESVIVRRLRGVSHGVIELNPRRPWRFKVQGPTWKTVLELAGLDVREIHVDSGATRLECFLPLPHGVVPIHISSGVVDVAIHRPRGAAMTAVVHTGAVRVRLDDYSAKVVVADVHWETPGGSGSGDRYELDISSGAMKLNADDSATPAEMHEPSPPPVPLGEPATALDILLDGVAARVTSRRT